MTVLRHAQHERIGATAIAHLATLRLLIFALVSFSAAWFGSWEWNPNNSTRMFAAITLVEDGDARIDRFAELTIDKAKFGDHYYLDKAPGMTLMAMPAVALVNHITGQTSHDVSIGLWDPNAERFLRARLRLAAATGPALLTAIAAVLLFEMGTALGGSTRAGAIAAIGYGLGTPVWGWSTTVFGHAAVASLLVIALWAVWRGTAADRAKPSVMLAALAGAALGWAVVVEYPAALFGGILGLWALWRLKRFATPLPAIGAAVAAGVVMLLPMVAYNLVAFGEPLRIGYAGVVGFDGMKVGLFGLTYPQLAPLFEVTLGLRRGMIWVAPVVVPGLIGLGILARGGSPNRDIGIVLIALVVAVFLYNASYVYWDGGNSTGPRHAVPALGPLALGLAVAWRAARGMLARGALLLILALSIAINACVAAAEIVTGGTSRFPLWSDVIMGRFAAAQLRTIGGEYWGMSAWTGFAVWAAIAALFLILIAQRVDRRT